MVGCKTKSIKFYYICLQLILYRTSNHLKYRIGNKPDQYYTKYSDPLYFVAVIEASCKRPTSQVWNLQHHITYIILNITFFIYFLLVLCTTDPCGQNTMCRDVPDSFVCTCIAGYTGNPGIANQDCIGEATSYRNTRVPF
jgi:hypothetical protein